MQGTLSVTGDLALLSELALQIERWHPAAVTIDLGSAQYLSWDVEAMATLLKRLHPYQLLLMSFVARADGRRSDPEVREKFAIGDSGLRGQTGPISKHVKAMRDEGLLAAADWVLAVDRSARTAIFVMPDELVPIVKGAIERPEVSRALDSARLEYFDERE
jgi:hypothetical protein